MVDVDECLSCHSRQSKVKRPNLWREGCEGRSKLHTRGLSSWAARHSLELSGLLGSDTVRVIALSWYVCSSFSPAGVGTSSRILGYDTFFVAWHDQIQVAFIHALGLRGQAHQGPSRQVLEAFYLL